MDSHAMLKGKRMRALMALVEFIEINESYEM